MVLWGFAGYCQSEGGGAYLPAGKIATLGGHFPPKKNTDKHSSVDALVAETGASWMTGKGWPRII